MSGPATRTKWTDCARITKFSLQRAVMAWRFVHWISNEVHTGTGSRGMNIDALISSLQSLPPSLLGDILFIFALRIAQQGKLRAIGDHLGL
jgi:hypothetical protein